MTGLTFAGALALAAVAMAAIIVLVYLLRQPPLTWSVRAWLALGLGVFPIIVGVSGNVAGMHATKQRSFCGGGCHVMDRHAEDAANLHSMSLAAIHSRNKNFGAESCYVCHADYGMYGFVLTKLGGMSHVVNYLSSYYKMPMDVAMREIRVNKPYPNRNCMQCHTTTAPDWLLQSDHAALLEEVRSGRTSCVSSGCHGFAHPFNKLEGEKQR